MAIERLSTPGDPTWRLSASDHLARYEFACQFTTGKRILDVGTGIGYGAAILKVRGALSVEALDIDSDVIDTARQLFGNTGVTYKVGDSEKLDITSGPYDVICSFENIEHLQNPDAFVKSAANRLAEDGVMICSTPDKEFTPPFVNGKPANPYHTYEWYRNEFRAMLEKHFKSVEMFVQVKGYGLVEREANLKRVFDTYGAVLREPVFRALSRMGAAVTLGRLPRQYPGGVTCPEKLAGPTPADFPVIQEQIAGLYGNSWCHVALCRLPMASE
jgi:SAM-dependent methyltransferase